MWLPIRILRRSIQHKSILFNNQVRNCFFNSSHSAFFFSQSSTSIIFHPTTNIYTIHKFQSKCTVQNCVFTPTLSVRYRFGNTDKNNVSMKKYSAFAQNNAKSMIKWNSSDNGLSYIVRISSDDIFVWLHSGRCFACRMSKSQSHDRNGPVSIVLWRVFE